ncbi:MAG: helix-turn-helix transcriptional regulator [Rickettsiaceae bacterium]|nr:helix-turn-helix transcriptional regulator [Rickettsiaceae bacterium]
MYNNIGERIAYCRNLLGISRPHLVKQLGTVSIASLNRWELNLVSIPKPQILKLVEHFNNSGIIVSADWLENGTGVAPINNNLVSLGEYNFDDATYIALSNLKSTFRDLQIYTISSSFFEPILRSGDYIAGFLANNTTLINQKECFVIQKNAIIVGIYDYHNKQLINFYNHKLILEDQFRIGEVIWSAKRL